MSSGYKLTMHLGTLHSRTAKGAGRGVAQAVEHALTEANKHVPHDEGTLERSGQTGTAREGDDFIGSVSYDTPYAVKQHEDMTLSHDGKGQAKWLETSMSEEAGAMGQIVATAMRADLQ